LAKHLDNETSLLTANGSRDSVSTNLPTYVVVVSGHFSKKPLHCV
jgi:hypothetical protein